MMEVYAFYKEFAACILLLSCLRWVLYFPVLLGLTSDTVSLRRLPRPIGFALCPDYAALRDR